MNGGVLLATLCLDEMEWLPRLWEQHRDWPELRRWVFVEATDRSFAEANPGTSSADGLSTDGTTEFLAALAKEDDRVQHVRYGFADHPDPALRKIGPRNRYWEIAAEVRPEFVVSVDADEFYTREDQGKLLELMRRPDYAPDWGWTIMRREIWRPPSIAGEPLFASEVVGGFWAIPCCHWWRWAGGVGHRECHNTPQFRDGRYLNDALRQLHDRTWVPAVGGATREFVLPQMIHMGFAAGAVTRAAKNRYYEGRGESADRQRRWYTESRLAWETWKPGDALPRGAAVQPYTGPVPEVFLEG